MSRLAIPIYGQILWATGDVRRWVEVDQLLEDNAGNWHPESFRVDSATDVTTFPGFRAKLLNLPIPQQSTSHATHVQTGLAIRSGVIRFRIAGLDPTEYALSYLFLGDPDNPPAGNPAAFPRKLLQPLSLRDWFRVTFDKDATAGAPHGEMILEKK